MLALTWASNALFCTFAHCVGSETLGMILIVLLVGKGLRLVRCRREPQWIDWYVFALILCLCLLSRHLNLGLISLLPAAFLFSWAQNRMSRLFASGNKQRLWLRRLGGRDLRHAVIAIAVGIAFLWRLHFLKDMAPESRGALLQKMAARTHSTDVRKLITLLDQMHTEGVDLWNWESFSQRAIQIFGGSLHWEKLDRALNQMALTFLLPPTPEHLHAARSDFVAGLKMPPTVISSYLFATTAYYFEHKDQMPECVELATFRNTTAHQIRQLPSQHLYFQLRRGLSYNQALVIWLMTLLFFVVLARRKKARISGIPAFGIALTAVGLLIFASTSLLHDYEPRFALTMWQLLLLSFFIFLGGTANLLARVDLKRRPGWSRPALRPL
jgi:hypothetical protein